MKTFFFSEITAPQLVLLNCLYEEKDTFHLQLMCQQAVPRFCMSTREPFSNTTSLPVTNEYDNGAQPMC